MGAQRGRRRGPSIASAFVLSLGLLVLTTTSLALAARTHHRLGYAVTNGYVLGGTDEEIAVEFQVDGSRITCRTSDFDEVSDGDQVVVHYAKDGPGDCFVGGRPTYDGAVGTGIAAGVLAALLVGVLVGRGRYREPGADDDGWVEGW